MLVDVIVAQLEQKYKITLSRRYKCVSQLSLYFGLMRTFKSEVYQSYRVYTYGCT